MRIGTQGRYRSAERGRRDKLFAGYYLFAALGVLKILEFLTPVVYGNACSNLPTWTYFHRQNESWLLSSALCPALPIFSSYGIQFGQRRCRCRKFLICFSSWLMSRTSTAECWPISTTKIALMLATSCLSSTPTFICKTTFSQKQTRFTCRFRLRCAYHFRQLLGGFRALFTVSI